MTFQKKLEKIVNKNNSLVCIGLDSDFEKLPDFIKTKKYPQFEFNKKIIEATADLVCAYKPNIAFYEAQGVGGIKQLEMTIEFLKKTYPEIPIILDAKRGDIGSSNKSYAKLYFDKWGVDGLTVHFYLGYEALLPFLERKDKGIFVLCKTSNPGAAEFQDLKFRFGTDRLQNRTMSLYQIVAKRVVENWNENKNCFLVVGATYPKELILVRKIVGNDLWILVPGVGAQGGDLKTVLQAGLNSKKQGLIINSSRGIIFVSNKKDFARKAREEAEKMKEKINYLASLMNKRKDERLLSLAEY